MQSENKATMSLMVFLMFTIIFASKANAGLDPQELVGDYLGHKCSVSVTILGDDQLKFSIRKKGQEVASDFLPFHRLETLTSPDEFSFERETIGTTGDEKRIVSGLIKGRRLRRLKLQSIRSIFSFKTKSCYNLVPLAPYTPGL